MTTTTNIPPRKQSGFTLIEALVTFLILAIGLLGLAGLQTKGLQFDQSAYQRTQAALLATDIADRMRANLVAAQASQYNVAYGTAVDRTTCVTSACTTSGMAAYDLGEWKFSMASILPLGDGSVTTAAGAVAPQVVVTITVYWDELRNGATGTHCPRESDSDLMCFQMQVTL